MNNGYDVASLGEILIDFLPDGKDSEGDNRFVSKAGGAPLNVLATVSRFGLKTSFIGKVGNDMFGKALLMTLKQNKIKSAVAIDSLHNTTLAFVKLDERGERDFSFYRNFGADIFLSKEDIDLKVIEQSKIFHFGSLSFTNEPSRSSAAYAVNFAKKCGCIISYDPNYREPLWESEDEAVNIMRENIKYSDIVKLSFDEAKMITEEKDSLSAAKRICNMGATVVIITDGANDIVYSINGETATVSPIKVNAVDTTGAGDIFFGSFLSYFLLSGKGLRDLSIANVCEYVNKAKYIAAQSVMKKGAISSIPKRVL